MTYQAGVQALPAFVLPHRPLSAPLGRVALDVQAHKLGAGTRKLKVTAGRVASVSSTPPRCFTRAVAAFLCARARALASRQPREMGTPQRLSAAAAFLRQ